MLSHPNGWEGAQQTQMRKAAALAGLIPDNQGGYDRIAFVTEGEASLHFSIRNGLPSSALKVRAPPFAFNRTGTERLSGR